MTQRRAYLRLLVASTPEIDWDAVYADLLPRVYNFFRYRVENDTTAEDLTAITLERAWQGRMRYRRRLSDFPTWVFGIARHVATDHFRRPEKTFSFESIPDRAADGLLEESIQRRHEIERLLALLASLSEREREIIALKYGAGLSNVEIAHVMKLSETNVSTLIYRIVGKLRKKWEEE